MVPVVYSTANSLSRLGIPEKPIAITANRNVIVPVTPAGLASELALSTHRPSRSLRTGDVACRS